MKAEKILINGTIYTGISEKPYRYLAWSGNRIVALGRGSGKTWMGRKTEVIDLRGMCATPAIIDSHMHFLDYALGLDRIKLDACASPTEILNVLRERAARIAPGEWILGRGWSKQQFAGFPHKRILDEIFPDHPVVLNSRDEHFLWVSSQALRAAGLKQPVCVPGGYIGMDPDGSPDGIIGENAIPLIRNHIARPDAIARRNAILAAQRKLHQLGIAGFHSTDANEAFGDLQDLHAEGKLRLRVFHSIPLRRLEDATRLSLKSGLGDSWFRFGFLKVFCDGTLGSQSAWMLEPFEGTGELGIETISEQELTEKIELALTSGIAVAVHAIGDRANRQVLNAFEKNAQHLSVPRARSRIEHAQLLHPQDISRFAKLGIAASMQPYHAISDCELAERFWGARARYSYAWRSLLESGAILSFGSDAPVEDPNPLQGLRAAVHRDNWKDRSQTISPFEALRAYTWNPAFVSGEAADRGSLEKGKLADFIVFSDDPYRTAFQEIRITGTAVNGEFVFREF